MKKFIQQYLLYFLPLFLMEFTFRFLENNTATYQFQVRSFIYILALSFALFFLNSLKFKKTTRVITIGLFTFYTFYFFIQVGMRAYYGSFFSARFLLKGVPDVQSYMLSFMAFLKPVNFLFLIYGVVGIVCYIKFRDKTQTINYISLISTVMFYGLFVVSLVFFDPPLSFEQSINLYKNPYYTDIAVHQLGLSAFLTTDLQYLVFNNAVTPTPEPTLPTEPEPTDPVVDLTENRSFDDSEWYAIKSQETDPVLLDIDNYLLSQKITERNDYTGIYEDKHFIMFLVEAFDMVAIDETLTPTLYKLKTEGSYFDHFYSPQFNCATAESELMSMSSLYPVIGTCTMNAYYQSTTPQTVFNLFLNAGYETQSYHNWNDQFYSRTKIHPFLGSMIYKDVEDTIPRLVSGWQSDLTMMETVVKDLNEKEGLQMTYVITSTTHFPYDKDSHLGNKYLDKVNQKYPDAPMHIKRYLSKAIELDLSIQYLLENYKDMDNTVLAFFSDHHPLNMPLEYLKSYSEINRSEFNGYNKTPFIIYEPNQESEVVSTPSSTIDMLPTIANLFDLNHDPRLYMGKDIYSDDSHLVIFQNGTWIDEVGMFNTYSTTFTPYDASHTYSNDEIQTINNKVKSKLAISASIYQNDYFDERPFIIDRFK